MLLVKRVILERIPVFSFIYRRKELHLLQNDEYRQSEKDIFTAHRFNSNFAFVYALHTGRGRGVYPCD